MPDYSDLLPQWREDSEAFRTAVGEQLSKDLQSFVKAEPGISRTPPSVTITRQTTAALVQRLAETIIPNCLQWLEDRSIWRRPDLKDVAADDIRRALSVTLRLEFHHQAARIVPAALGWLFIVALGAMAGGMILDLAQWALALPPDVTNRRAVVSAALGAGLAAYLTSRMLDRPEQRHAFEAAAGSKGLFTRYRAIKAALVQSGAGRGALGPWVLFYLLRPSVVPPTAEDRLQNLGQQLRRELSHASDLVLALCITHPDRDASPEGLIDTAADREPRSVYEAIGALSEVLSQGPERQDELRDVAEELMQRFEEEGFEWHQVDKDAIYDRAMEDAYRAYGLLEDGQPVLTRKPALFRHGKLLIRGILAARK